MKKIIFSTAVIVAFFACKSNSQPNNNDAITANILIEKQVVTTFKILVHTAFNVLLKAHVSDEGTVNYDAFVEDKSKLENYLNTLQKTPPTEEWNRNQKLAYWINLYNASTIDLILQHYPVTSITEINAGKPWDKVFIKSGDKLYSLNQIENEIIRPTFKEPRIHFAINCAAKSCPKLMNATFEAEHLDAQLEKQAKEFVNNSVKNTISVNSFEISKIFEWYAADFGDIIAFLNQYSNTKIGKEAKKSYKEYIWDLNK